MLAHSVERSVESTSSNSLVMDRIKSWEVPNVDPTTKNPSKRLTTLETDFSSKFPVLHQNHIRTIMHNTLRSKTSLAEDQYYHRLIQKILSDVPSAVSIRYQDQILFSNNEKEHLKNFLNAEEGRKKLKRLTKYYQYHNDTPRLFMKPIADVMRKYYYAKRAFECQKLKLQVRHDNFTKNLQADDNGDYLAENKQQINAYKIEGEFQFKPESSKSVSPQALIDVARTNQLREDERNNENLTNDLKYMNSPEKSLKEVCNEGKDTLCDLSLEGSIIHRSSGFLDSLNENGLMQCIQPKSMNLTLKLDEILKNEIQSYQNFDRGLSTSSFSTPKHLNSGFQSQTNIADLIEEKEKKKSNVKPEMTTIKDANQQKNDCTPSKAEEKASPLPGKSKVELRKRSENNIDSGKKKTAFAKVREQLMSVNNVVNQLKDFMQEGLKESQEKFFANTQQNAANSIKRVTLHSSTEKLCDKKNYMEPRSQFQRPDRPNQFSSLQRLPINSHSYSPQDKEEKNIMKSNLHEKKQSKRGHSRGQSAQIFNFNNNKKRPTHSRGLSDHNFESNTNKFSSKPSVEQPLYMHSQQNWGSSPHISPVRRNYAVNNERRFDPASSGSYSAAGFHYKRRSEACREAMMKDYDESARYYAPKNQFYPLNQNYNEIPNRFGFPASDPMIDKEDQLLSRRSPITRFSDGNTISPSPKVFRHVRSATSVYSPTNFAGSEMGFSRGVYVDPERNQRKYYTENWNGAVFATRRENWGHFY